MFLALSIGTAGNLQAVGMLRGGDEMGWLRKETAGDDGGIVVGGGVGGAGQVN